jgi:spore photoproduct lyase
MVKTTALFERVKTMFKNSKYIEIESLKNFTKNKSFTIKDYNNRADNLFLIKEKYDFFKRCPCTYGVINCGYSIINLGVGCIYDCTYCFLQGYQNIAGIIIPYNIEDYLCDEKIISSTKGFFNYKRIGSGEFTDSLIFDNITNFSTKIINFFKTKSDIFFEFKTKSINIENVLKSPGVKNIVLAWSVNSLKISMENEFNTPSIEERLYAAKKCSLAGFSTAFHFDPIIYCDNWKQDYRRVIDMIFDIVPVSSIKWISLGTLRMPAMQKTIIENRFPNTKILNGELLLGSDYKLRYSPSLRIEIYRYLNQIIQSKKSKTILYLCMEEKPIWEATFKY